jgi:hypothetical protein
MIVDKFNKDFSKGNKNISKLIEETVTDYFGKEKVTEDSLRQLKQKVAKAVEDYRRDSRSGTPFEIQKRASSPPSARPKSTSATPTTTSAARPPPRSPTPSPPPTTTPTPNARAGPRRRVRWLRSRCTRWRATTTTSGRRW